MKAMSANAATSFLTSKILSLARMHIPQRTIVDKQKPSRDDTAMQGCSSEQKQPPKTPLNSHLPPKLATQLFQQLSILI